MMSLKELESTIAQLPRNEKAELLRFLSRELRQSSAKENAAKSPATPVDRTRWFQKLERLRALTASDSLRPTQEILDELREDRI
ncbi:MAG: hypothetical protein ACKV2Q_14615 [Planctomycetaceae bacterium]